MSKGGAGKVYFVLYLAVILELLIIFIERDEAEEGLRKQQQQAIQIVQTILSQLQTGSGTTGITVSPKDNIVLDPEEPANNVRNYDVMVSVGDPRASVTANGKTIRGDDVPKLEYIVSYIGNPDIEETELGEDTTDILNGNVIFKAELGTDIGSYSDPRQTFGGGIPADVTTGYFALNEEKTNKQLAQGRRVKVFSVNFKPNQGKGWYRLRFNSQTNKILGIAGGEPNPTDTIRIGNVKLTVKQLQQVRDVLLKQKGKTEEGSNVENYIETLLKPGGYLELEGNKGFQSFNVRVTEPPAVEPQDPVAEVIAPDTTYWYNIAPFSVQVKLGPKEGTKDVAGGASMKVADESRNLYIATYSDLKEGTLPIIAKASNAGKVETSEKQLVVEAPAMRTPFKRWKGMRATVSRKYNPTSDWVSTKIPASHYQTVVEMNGREVFNRPGFSFKDAELPADLMVTEGTKDIKMTVFWKPGGTADRTQWKPLLTNQKGGDALLKPEEAFEIGYPAPEHVAGFEFDFVLSARNKSVEYPDIELKQKIAENRTIGVANANAACAECTENGLAVRLIPGGEDGKYSLRVEVADMSKVKPSINGKRFEVMIDMTGRGGATGVGVVVFTVKIAR